jgi:hypothetical protein
MIQSFSQNATENTDQLTPCREIKMPTDEKEKAYGDSVKPTLSACGVIAKEPRHAERN